MVICGLILVAMAVRLSHLITEDQHLVDLIVVTEQCEKLLVDMETSERGYKVTGDPQFLQLYQTAAPLLDAHLADMSRLAKYDGDYQEVEDIQAGIADWRKSATEWIAEGKYDASPRMIEEFTVGKAKMDAIRAKMEEFLGDERKHLSTGRSELGIAQNSLLYAGFAGLLGIMVFTGWHVWRQIEFLAQRFEKAVLEVTDQKERFQVTLASIGDAVIVTDINGKTTFMNAEAERMTGWPWPEAKGKPLRNIFRIVNEETRRTVDDPVEKVFKEKRVVGLANHTLLLSKNGAEWPIEDSAAPVYDLEGKTSGVVLVFHDATELRRAQRVLKTHADDLEQKVLARTMELQRTISELEAFSYTVSHDLRAPLRAMQGYASALLQDYASRWGAEEKDLLTRIKNAAERLDVLIQDVLTYSKISKERCSIEPVDLDALVHTILTQYPTFQDSRMTFQVERPL